MSSAKRLNAWLRTLRPHDDMTVGEFKMILVSMYIEIEVYLPNGNRAPEYMRLSEVQAQYATKH